MKKSKMGIWHYVKSYKFNSIFIKTFLLVVLPTVIPLMVISASIYNFYSGNIREEIKTANKNGLSQIKNLVDKTALECDRLSVQLVTEMDIKLLLSYKEIVLKDFFSYEKFQNLNKIMGIISTTNEFIGSVYVYFEKSDFVLSTDGYSMDFPSFPDKEWRESYLDMKKTANYWVAPRVVSRPLRSDQQYYLSSFRTVSNYNENGVVIVNVDIQRLKKIIDNEEDKNQQELYIMDKNGVILYSADSSMIGKNMNEVERLVKISQEEPDSFFRDEADSTDKIVTMQNSEYNSWKYMYIAPASRYSQRGDEFFKFMLLSLMTCFMIAIAISFFISIKVFQPIKNMVSLLDRPSEWQDIIRIEDKKNFNEFKYVANSILTSIDRTREMEEALAERMELLRKAQGIALQAQINPHFLYNTLDTINWKAMALTGGDNDVSDMLASLSQLLRLSLETENSLVTIETEIAHAELYLNIQKIRYRDKFEVFWDMDERIMKNKIVKLTIQPLIENAIYHGIKPKKEKGVIAITGLLDESHISLEIMDNGMGMSEEEVMNLNMKMKEGYTNENVHIGMGNVNQRIKLFFGEEYGITVNSEYKKYTKVKIIIPMVE